MPGGDKPAITPFDALAAKAKQAANQRQEADKAKLIENNRGGGSTSSGDSKSLTEDEYNTGMDMGIPSSQLLDPLTNENQLFADNQTGLSQVNAALTGGLMKGGLTLLENAGYLGDVKGMLDSTDDMDNWLSEMARSGKEWVDKELPIYRQSPSEVWDLDDPAWYAQQIQGLVDSGVGFTLTGFGAGAIAGKLANTFAKAVSMGVKGEQYMSTLGSAVMTNYAESKMMGLETYDKVYKTALANGKSDEEAQQLGKDAGKEVIINNKVNIITDALQLDLLFKTPKLASAATLPKENWLLTAGKAPVSEAAEEVSSGAIQTVAEEQGISKAMSQKPRNASEIAKEYLTSSQAGLEATLGAIGGQAQKGGIYGAKKVGEATGILSKPPTKEPVAPTKTYQDLAHPGEFTKDEVKVRAENPGDKPLSPLERMMAANPKMDEKEAKMKTSSDTHAQNAYKASLSVWNKKNDAYQKEVKASDEYTTAKTEHEAKIAEYENNKAEKAKYEDAMKQHALDVQEYERHHGTAPEKLKSKIKDALANNEVFALEKAKAFRNGDFIKAKQIDDNIFTDLTASVFSTGRSESLKEQLKAVIEDPNTDPKDKNNAREYLTKLPEMETSYNVLADKHGQKVGHQLFILDQRKKSTQEAVTKLAEKQDPIKNKLTVQIAGGEQLAMSYEQKELISLSSEIDAIENNIKDATKAAFEGGTDNSITEALTKKIESFRKRKNELENTISEMKIDKVSNEILNRYDSLEELEKLATDKSDLYYASLIYDRQYKSLASPNFIKNVENKTKSHFIDRASNASSSVELEMLSKQIQGSSLKENDKTALMDVIAKRLPGIRENEDSTSHKNVMREETKNKVSYIKAKLNNEIDNANADLSDTMSKMFENFMSKIGSPLTEETKEVNKKAKSGKPSTDKTSSAILKAMAEVDNVADTAALLAHGPSGKDKVAKMKRGVAKAIQKEEQKETHPEVVLPGDSLPLGKVTKGTGKMKSARLGAPLPPLEDVAPLVQDEYGNDANTPPEYWEGPTGLLEGEVDEVYELQQLNTELGILQNQELDMTPVPNTEIAPTSSLIVNPEPLSDDDSTVVPLTVVYTNITDLARKGKYDPEVDAFERWVENPRINKVGKKVLLSINFDYLAEQDAKRKAAGKTSYVYNNILSKSAIDLTSFDLPVTMTVVDENNEPIKIGEVELKAYLRDNTRKDISEADKAEIRKIKMAVYDAYIKGDKVYSKVSSISGGKLLHDTTGQLETPVLSLKPFFRDGVFNILLGDQAGLPGLFKNEKDFDRDFVNTTPKNGGFAYLPVKSANGRPYPLRLNLSRVGEDNAHALYDIFTRMTQGVKSSDYIDGVEGFDGLTYAEAISMIAFEGPKSATTGFPLHFSNTKKAKTVTFGDVTLSHEAFLTPERRADFVQIVSNMWSPVDKKRINKSLWDSDNGIKSRTFTFLGKVYDKSEGDKSYNEFIAERGIIHSNAYEENGAIFKSPVVTLAMPFREKGSPVATSTAEEVAKVESTQPTNNVTSPSVDAIEIPVTSSPAPTTTEAPKGRDRFKGVATESAADSIKAPLNSVYRGPVSKVDTEQELEWLKEVLPNVPVRVQDTLLGTGDNQKAEGMFYNGMITLSRAGNKGVAYHEAFHAVSQMYLSPTEMAAMYDTVRSEEGLLEGENGLRPMTNLECEEHLAEEFRKYMLNQKPHSNKAIQWLFDQIEKLVNLFKGNKARIFSRIRRGAYNYIPVFNTEAKLYSKVNLNATELKALIDITSYLSITKGLNIDELNKDIDAVNEGLEDDNKQERIESVNALYDYIGGMLYNTAEKFAAEGRAQEADIINRGLDNWELVIEEVKDNIKRFNLKELSEDEMEAVESASGENYSKASYQFDGKNNASGRVKFRVAMLPTAENSIIGLPSFANMAHSWNTLKKELGGLVDDSQSTGYEKMVSKLTSLVKDFPQYSEILDDLLNPALDKFHSEFFVAMTGQINTFSATTVVKTKTGMKVKVFNADTQSQRYHVRNAWIENFNEKFLDEEGKIKNAEGLKTLSERYGEIKVKDNVQEARTKAIAALNYIGINVSEEAFDRYVNNQKGSTYANRLTIAVGIRGLGSLLNKKSTINNLHKAVSDLTYDHTDKSVIQDNTQIMKLAEAQADLSYLPGDSTVVSSQGTAYIFSQNNNISKFISALKSDPEGTLHVLNNRQYNESSRWLDWLSKKEDDTTIINDKGEEELLVGEYLNIKNFNSETFLSLRKENSDDEGSSYSDLIAIDELVDRINRTLQGHYSPLTFADKSTQINFTGPSLYKTNTKFDGAGNIVLSDNGNTSSIFTDYLMTELRRVSMVYDHIYGNEERGVAPISDNEKVQFFHTKGKDGLIGGLKLQFFAELTWKDEYKDPSTIPALYKELITKIYDKNGRPNLSGLKDGNTTFNRYVEHILNKEINVTKERVFGTGVITTKGIEAIDSTVKDKYIADKSGDVVSAASSIIADYTVNAMIANIEFTKIFSGDPAFYKSLDDLKKRAPASIAPGTDLRLKDMSDAETKFNIAVLNDEEHKSELYDEYLKIYSKTMGVEKATELLSPYKKVNEADAQAYITPNRFRFIMDRLGKWTADHDVAFEKMMKGEDVNPADLALMQPLKGVLFQQRDINLNGDVFGVPMYLKYSQAVLFPGMIKGTKLQDVYDKMVAPNAKVDELIFNSGVKVGAEGQANIFDDQYHPITLNNTNWKLQQDLPSKYWAKGYALEGSQVKKVIQANIVPTDMYGDMTGSDILNELSSLETQLSDLSLSELKDKWGVQMENGQVIKVNQMKLRKSIIKSLKDKDSPKNVIDALQRGEPFDAIPQFLDKIESELVSAVTKAAVKLNMPGGSFVQLSNVGFEKKIGYEQLDTRQRNDIIYLNEGKPLRGPRYEKDENGNNVFKPGEVFIPHKIVDTILGTAWHNMSAAEIKMHLKDAGLLDDLIGYRIPTQGPSSIDNLEIAGILPRSVGDTVVVYREITAKTGSDFDIDKMFIMMPNYTHINGKFVKVPSNGTSKEALQNRKLELYKKILTSPNKFIELTKPLDAAWLKEDANYIAFISNEYKSLSEEAKEAFGLLSLEEKHSYIDKFNNNKTLSGLSFVSPIYQQDVKQSFNGGKNGVGQTANQLVDHILGQQAGLFLRKKLGVGRATKEGYMDISQIYDVNGGMIVDNISAFLNAYVDIAKDPYVFDINNNTYTANVVFMLLRAGVDAKFINRLMSQPAIVELAKEHFAGESEIINPTLGGVDRRTQPYERVLAKRYGVSANSKIDLLAPLDLKGITSDFLEEQLLDEDPVFQARLLSTFLDLREAASSLAESIKASKTDTKGVGMNLAEATVTKELRNKILSEGLIGNFDKKFQGTNLETYTKNSINFAQAVLGPLFISQSSQVYNSAKSIFKMIGDDHITDDELLKSIYKEFYAFSLSNFTPLQSTGEELDALLKGDKSVSNRLKLLKAHDKYKHNLLINTLSTRKGFKSAHSTITIAGTKKKDRLDSDSITAAWDDLLNSEHPNIKKFAEDLVKYSYITSGFKKNIGSFFDLIPSGWLAQQGLTEYIEKIRSSNNTSTNNAFIDQFIRNHSDNYKLAPNIKLNDDTSYAPKKMSKDQIFILNPKFYKYLEIGTDNKGRKIYKPYVTVGKKLFKCSGLDRNSNPVYARVSKLGSSDPKTGRVIEYNPDNIDLKSVIDTVVSTVIPEGVIAATPEYQNFDVKKEDVTFDFILDTYPNYKDKEPVVKFTNINENFKIGEVIDKGKTRNVLQVEAGGVWKNLGDASDTKENALALGKLYLNDMGAKQWNELYYNLNIC